MVMALFIFFIGATFGAIIVAIIYRLGVIGDLRVDRSDTYDGPYLFLELNKGIDNFSHQKYVLLKVKNEDFPRK